MENNSNLSLKSLSSDEINKIEEFRKSKQTAVLAILFSDIVNSTYATEKLGEQTYSKLRHIHDELFKKIMCRDNAGIIIKEIGDSFLCVFAEPSTAVLRAIEFQRAIHSNKENLTVQDYTLTVKIGIHVGQVAVENSLALDIFGRHVNRASRIQAIAHGGQILTSQSIWENAVGWLKDNSEEKIGWISYGKTKLKGIDERVDIFGFYPKEIGKSHSPKIIRRRKQNRTILFFVAFAILVGLSFIAVKKIKEETKVLPVARKSYYVQFDLSAFTQQDDINFQKTTNSSSTIKELLLAQIITAINPDSIVTESDLIKSYSKKGKIYVRHEGIFPKEEKYFKDTLNLTGAIFIKRFASTEAKKDTITFSYERHLWTDCCSHGEKGTMWSSFKKLKANFRNFIQDWLVQPKLAFDQAFVLECNDSIVLFQLTKKATLHEGASIRYCTFYTGKEGSDRWFADHKKRVEYLKDKPQYSDELNSEMKMYEGHKAGRKDSNGSICVNEHLQGKVIELYDSTGRATWRNNGVFPFIKPQKGDKIHLDDDY